MDSNSAYLSAFNHKKKHLAIAYLFRIQKITFYSGGFEHILPQYKMGSPGSET